MRKSTVIMAALAMTALAVCPAIAQVQKGTNGQFWFDDVALGVGSGGLTGVVPTGWTAFDDPGAGGRAFRWSTGSSSDRYSVSWENEPNWAAESGHSMLLGGVSTTAGAQWGVSQTVNTTPGKIYMMLGAMRRDQGTADANARFGVGMNNGTSRALSLGLITDAMVGRSGSSGNLIRSSQFWASTVADNSGQITGAIGSGCTGAVGGGRATYVDGVRFFEFDTAPHAALVNGNFEGGTTDLSQWMANGSDEGATPGNRGFIIPNGWIPLGGTMGPPGRFSTGIPGSSGLAGAAGITDNALLLDEYNGLGRGYFLQRVTVPAGKDVATFAADIFGYTVNGDAKIGIDTTGGLDPSLASWISPAAYGSLQNASLSVGVTPGSVVTVYLATGYNTIQGSAVSGGAWFNNASLTFTPEPATIGLLAIGSLLLVRRRR